MPYSSIKECPAPSSGSSGTRFCMNTEVALVAAHFVSTESRFNSVLATTLRAASSGRTATWAD